MKKLERLCVEYKFITSIAPELALLTTGDKGELFWRQRMIPSTPKRYPTRIIAPKFYIVFVGFKISFFFLKKKEILLEDQ